jgi:hypothetical protein
MIDFHRIKRRGFPQISVWERGGNMYKALLVVDVQNDFYETGSLPVNGANEINEVINRLTLPMPKGRGFSGD